MSSSFDGGEGGDAVCQIIKELADNAVDACRTSASTTADDDGKAAEQRVVRITIHPEDNDEDCQEQNKKGLLKVTVSDNGCGMEDIRQSVEAFSSSKGHNHNTNTSNDSTDNTFGRYGIGLTRT